MSAPDEGGTRADILLREALGVMTPLARLLVSNGVPYPVFAQALKGVFLAAAREELMRERKRVTDSALSLLSGVHRKDVRAMSNAESADLRKRNRAFSMAADVTFKWSNDPQYADADGRPRPLPLRSKDEDAPSFEQLTRSVSKDFHSRSVLDEMVRLGVARLERDIVTLNDDGFVPSEGFAELAYFFGTNARDHLAASEANLRAIARGEKPPFVEYAMTADEITAESAAELQQLARRLWINALKKMNESATERVAADRPRLGDDGGVRIRFGSYFFTEPVPGAPQAAGSTGEGEHS